MFKKWGRGGSIAFATPQTPECRLTEPALLDPTAPWAVGQHQNHFLAEDNQARLDCHGVSIYYTRMLLATSMCTYTHVASNPTRKDLFRCYSTGHVGMPRLSSV